MGLLGISKRAKRAWSDAGFTGLRHGWSSFRRRLKDERAYRRWMIANGISPEERGLLADQVGSFATRPLISVVVPVYNVDERWLRRCIDSVVDQIYPHWELCIADDASPAPHVRAVLEEYAAKDDRIKLVFRSENGHISAASNSALELATGEFTVLLDHDDELSSDALFRVADELNSFPGTKLIYSDEDLIDERGMRFAPKFKPDFSRDLFFSLNLLTHLSAYRTDLVRGIGGFRIGFEGSQDYDLALRALEKVDESQIRHIPRVLYHWRVIRGSVAFSMDEKPYAHERARRAIREHFERTGVEGNVVESFHNLHRVVYGRAKDSTFCVIASSGADGMSGIERRLSAGRNVPIAVDTLGPDRGARLNDAASRSSADVLIFLDADLRITDEIGLEELAAVAMQPGVGAVGGRILTADMFVEEAGIILGSDLSPAPAHHGFPRGAPGNIFRNRQVGNYSSVSISCLAISRRDFETVGGFDASVVPGTMFDVDLCLRLREAGKRIVVLPHVEFVRNERAPARHFSEADLEEFRKRWPAYVELDPFCNPNLKRDGTFEIDV